MRISSGVEIAGRGVGAIELSWSARFEAVGLETVGSGWGAMSMNAISGSTETALSHGPITLRPLNDVDVGFFYGHAAANRSEWFPLSGRQAGPFEFNQLLWADVLDQLVVHILGAPAPVGLLRLVQPDLTNGFARFEHRQVLACAPELLDAALFLFLEHAFTAWPLRKVYVERAGFQAPALGALAEICRREGRLADHVFHDRLYWDYFIEAIYHEEWIEWKERARDRFLGPMSTSAETSAASGPVVRISDRSFPVT